MLGLGFAHGVGANRYDESEEVLYRYTAPGSDASKGKYLVNKCLTM